jgi:hypothetical protein
VITSGTPANSYLCHCIACQRRTGAIVHSGAHYHKDQLRFEGESKIYARISDTGFEVRFHFCPDCGTSVYWETNKYPNQCGIAVGCFADPEFPPPTRSIWEESKHDWLGLPEGIEHLKKGVGPNGRPME